MFRTCIMPRKQDLFTNGVKLSISIMSEFINRLDALAQLSRQKLVDILDSIPGEKNFIIEPSVMKPLERFISATVLKSHGVGKIFKLEKLGHSSIITTSVYLIPADLIRSKRVCDQINAQLSILPGHKFHVIFIPRKLTAIDHLFEEEGLYGKVTFHVLSWELIQLDTKILSFELPQIFQQLFIHKDQSLLPATANSLWSLQHLFGKINFSLFLGHFSKHVSNMTDTWFDEMGVPDKLDPDIGCLIVMDRDIDYTPVLLTPGTYTSLVADVMPVKSGVVEISKSDSDNKNLANSLLLTSKDDIYNQIKNKHFSEVFLYLNCKIKEFSSEMGKRNNSSIGIQEMKDFVKNELKQATTKGKALKNHIDICEKVLNDIGQKFESLQTCQVNILGDSSRKDVISYIEEIMATGREKNLALRLICLLSLTQNGFSYDEGNSIRTQFLHAYGYEHLHTFYNLEKMGLFLIHPSTVTSLTDTSKLASKVAQVVSLPRRSAFQNTATKMKLFPDTDNYSLKDPQDLGYVFGGAYIPLVVQLVNFLLKKENTLDEITKWLPGNFTQNNKSEVKWVGKSTDSIADVNPRSFLVYIVGGITYAEIAAFQLLEKKTGCRIIVSGTHIMTGNSLVSSAMS